jgi:hypothetical protein
MFDDLTTRDRWLTQLVLRVSYCITIQAFLGNDFACGWLRDRIGGIKRVRNEDGILVMNLHQQ